MTRRELCEEIAAWALAALIMIAIYSAVAAAYRGLLSAGGYLSVWMLRT